MMKRRETKKLSLEAPLQKKHTYLCEGPGFQVSVIVTILPILISRALRFFWSRGFATIRDYSWMFATIRDYPYYSLFIIRHLPPFAIRVFQKPLLRLLTGDC